MLKATVFSAADLDGRGRAEVFHFSQDTVSVGRSSVNDLCVPNPHISKHHGEIRRSKGTYRYKDQGSTNGSIIRRKGKEIHLSTKTIAEYELKDGDEILLGIDPGMVVIKLEIQPQPEGGEQVAAGESTIVKTFPLQQMDVLGESVLRDSRAIDALYRFIQSIQPANRPDEICQIGAEAVLEVFEKASHVVILKADPEEDAYLPVATRGRQADDPNHLIPVSQSIIQRVVRAGESILFENAMEEFQDSKSIAESRVLSGVCCPLWHRGELAGVLQVTSREATGLFDQRDLEILTLAGNQLAMKLQTVELVDSLVKAEEMLRIENENLEDRVRERTQALEETLQSLKNTQVQLVHSEKMASLGTLVAGVAHELNNPISFIYDNLGFLEKYVKALLSMIDQYEGVPLGKGVRAQIDRIKEELNLEFVRTDLDKLQENFREGAERTKRIVTDLRTFSRLDEAERKMVDLHEGLESTLALLTNKLKNVVRVHRRYGDLPQVECYPGQLNQVFVNLLTNAADAIAGEGDMWITTEYHEAEDCVRIKIEDNGQGIPEEDIPKLFDPFFTTKDVGRGTGLGLSVSYGIVERHEGRIEVESEVGKGSAFTVVLPVRMQEDGEAP
jgi:signal transduction histidine kinase